MHDPVIVAANGVLGAVAIGVAYWWYALRKLERKRDGQERDGQIPD
jgi:hypothetical protein